MKRGHAIDQFYTSTAPFRALQLQLQQIYAQPFVVDGYLNDFSALRPELGKSPEIRGRLNNYDVVLLKQRTGGECNRFSNAVSQQQLQRLAAAVIPIELLQDLSAQIQIALHVTINQAV